MKVVDYLFFILFHIYKVPLFGFHLLFYGHSMSLEYLSCVQNIYDFIMKIQFWHQHTLHFLIIFK